MKKNSLSKKIAELITKNIMIYHDNAQYELLKKNSKKLLKAFGYNEEKSLKASEKIKQIYIHYDKADDAFKKNDERTEKKEYNKARNLALEMNIILATDYDCRLMIDWVYYWRHKKVVKALLTFLKDWRKKTGSTHIAIRCAVHIKKAGKHHDNREIKKFQKEFEKVYDLILKKNLWPLPIFF